MDVILFNPPYVPTDHEESFRAQGSAGIAGSWAGGPDGVEITNRFLDDVKVCHTLGLYVTKRLQWRQDLLSDCGRFYLVALAQNNIPEICERMQNKFNMNSRVGAPFY